MLTGCQPKARHQARCWDVLAGLAAIGQISRLSSWRPKLIKQLHRHQLINGGERKVQTVVRPFQGKKLLCLMEPMHILRVLLKYHFLPLLPAPQHTHTRARARKCAHAAPSSPLSSLCFSSGVSGSVPCIIVIYKCVEPWGQLDSIPIRLKSSKLSINNPHLLP